MPNTPMADQDNSNQQVPVGTPVFAASGEKIGTVSKRGVQGDLLYVQKGRLFPEEFSVPRAAIARQDTQEILLNLSKEELGLH